MNFIRVDHTGERFGSLIAVERLPKYKNGVTYYRCKCDCGNETIVHQSGLTNGKTTSCGCYRKNKLTNSLQEYVGSVFGKLTVLEAFIHNEPKFKCRCSCGEIRTASIKDVLSGKVNACKKCAPMKQLKLRKDLVGSVFGKLTVTEMLYRYRGIHTYCKCSCECGNETIVYLGNLTQGTTSSCGCYGADSRYLYDHSKDFAGLRIGKLVFIEKTSMRESNNSIVWKCVCDCGKEVFTTRGRAMQTGSCGCDTGSIFERFVSEVLDDLKIPYVREKIFKDCIYIRPLRFDFYIEECNLIIEADGRQHHMPVEYFGGEGAFKEIVVRDSIKNQYCKSNNIRLLRIEYTLNKNDIQQQIIDYINPVTITA